MAVQKIPFDFILDYLLPLNTSIRAMFGCHAIYVGKKLMIILRKRKEHPFDNGIWIATTREHHESLKKDFPHLRNVGLLANGKTTEWQNLPYDTDDFETSAVTLCQLLIKKDKRIGKVAKKKKPRSKKTSAHT